MKDPKADRKALYLARKAEERSPQAKWLGHTESGHHLVSMPVERLAHGYSRMEAEKVEAFKKMPPPVPPVSIVSPHEVDGKWWVEDGNHRVAAARERGDSHIPAIIHKDDDDALKQMGLRRPERKAGGPVQQDLFDMSLMHEQPKVPQFDLPRNDPPRGVTKRVADLIASKAVAKKVMEHIERGQQMGGADWYNAEPLRKEFVDTHGEHTGNAMFHKYMDFVAATSPRSDVGANVRNASYYFVRHAQGKGVPEIGEANPKPYGHMAQRLHQMNAQRVAGEGWDPLNNPKPASFVENLTGNQRPVTVDTHAFRLPAILAQDPRFLENALQTAQGAPRQNIQKMVESGEIPMAEAAKRAAYWQPKPKANEYGAMERYYQGIAKKMGMTPAQTQASAWVGGGNVTGLASDATKPFMGFVNDRIHKTAAETGREPQDVLKQFVRGEQPLLATGGAALRIARRG